MSDEPCTCKPPPMTDGPDEDCPQHGRPYSYWVQGYDALDQRLNTLLTSEEVELVEKLGSLMADFTAIADAGRRAAIERRVGARNGTEVIAEDLVGLSTSNDMWEVMLHVHALQNMVLAQAAARAYDGSYRLLGGSLR